jgi:hypothetical protein
MDSLAIKIVPKYKEAKWKNENSTEKGRGKLRALGYIQ